MRVLALDLGAKRIGVAVSDSAGRVATAVTVLARSGQRSADHEAVAALVAEYAAERLVVGLPLSLDGRSGPAAAGVEAECQQLAACVDVPVDLHDERLSTVSADRVLRDQGLDSRARRRVVDMVAASIILQDWLDRRAAVGEGTLR